MWCDAVGDIDRGPLVTAGGQSGGLPGGVDATHLHRDRGEAGSAEHQNRDQRGDRQSRFDGARADIVD